MQGSLIGGMKFPIGTTTLLINRFKEIIRAHWDQEGNDANRGQRKNEILMKWISPTMDWIMLNTNGVAEGNPRVARGGGFSRGARGEWLGG